MMEKWYINHTVSEVVAFLIDNYAETPQTLIEEINKVMAQHWADEERACGMGRPILWFDKEKNEIRKEIQLFRTFEIKRNSYTHPFDVLCKSEYSNCFTRLIISYKDEDDDYIELSHFLVSPYFQNLSFLQIKDLPMSTWEEDKFIEMLSMRPQLKEIELYYMFDFKKRVEQYVKDLNLPIQVTGKY